MNKIDEVLREIEKIKLVETSQPLKFIPHIGEEYFQIPEKNRIMILGESFYGWKEAGQDAPQVVVSEHINFRKKRYLTNISKAVCGKQIDKKTFWEKVIFNNCVQRVLEERVSKPSSADFWQGAHFTYEQIKILKPTLVVSFKGNYNEFYKILEEKKEKIIKEGGDKIGGIKAQYLKTENISIAFIRHPSSYFNWGEWHKFLKEIAGETLEYFENL